MSRLRLVRNETLESLTRDYMTVQQCWNDPEKATRSNMTYGKAIKTLVNIQKRAGGFKNGSKLYRRASILLNEVVSSPMEIDKELEAAT